jgi:hypothetical protein
MTFLHSSSCLGLRRSAQRADSRLPDTEVVVSPAPLRRLSRLTATRSTGRAAGWLVACWTLVGAVGFAYLFATVPVTELGEPGLFGPAWLQDVAFTCGILFGLPSFVLPVLWLPFGIHSLHRERFETWRRVAWIAGTAAAIYLEALVITGVGVPLIAPNYLGAGIVSWVQLAESGGFLLIGIALAAILTVKPGRPQAVPG